MKTYGTKEFSVKGAYKKYQKDGYPAEKIKIDAFRKRIEAVAKLEKYGYWVIKPST